MRAALIGLTIFCFALLTQAVPESSVLSETVVDVEEVSLKRSIEHRQYKLHALGEDIELDLRKNDDLLPVNLPVYVYGEDEDGNPTVDDWTHRTDSGQGVYTDKKTGASILVDESGDEMKLNGLLGQGLVIEPVEDVTPAEDTKEKREVRRVRHVIYKVKQQEEDVTTDDFIELTDNKVADEANKEKRDTLTRIYVPVHVVVDYKLWTKLGRDEPETIKYIKIFYNAVNDVYSSISYPSVSVSIQGITICKSASACDMVESSRLGSDGVNAKTALSAIAKYAYDKRSTTGEDYALMMVMTDYDLCSPESSGTCKRSTAGLAYVATVCDSYRSSKTSKTGIAEDHGAYDGIKTVSHEMGHILGMKHDGDGPARTGAPGARSCSWTDHYLMGQTAFVLNNFQWSKCSVDQLRWLIAQSSAACVRSAPSNSSYSLIKALPGKALDLDNQCKAIYGSTSQVGCRLPGVNSGNDQICLGLMCKVGGNRCSSKTPAAEGSYCGPQRYCRQGRCVCDPSAPLPTVPPKDPSCTGDSKYIRIGGKKCDTLFLGNDGLKSCESSTAKTYCCESAWKYCRATPITCDGSDIPTTPKPTPPVKVYTVKTTPKVTFPSTGSTDDNCGNPCKDTPNLRISGRYCKDLLSSSSDRQRYCDNPTIIRYCCATRKQNCNGYHWITDSCNSNCQDNPSSSINGLKCIPFLSSSRNRENFCNSSVVKRSCCASRSKFCQSDNIIG